MSEAELSDTEDSKDSVGIFAKALVWTRFDRDTQESRMDVETAASLRCYLSGDFNAARSWDALVTTLSAKGFSLHFDGDRLVLVNDHTGVQLCTCTYLGFPFAELANVLGKPSVVADTGRIISSPKHPK